MKDWATGVSLKEGHVTEEGQPHSHTGMTGCMTDFGQSADNTEAQVSFFLFTHDACQHPNYLSSLSLSMDWRVFPPWVSPVRQSVLLVCLQSAGVTSVCLWRVCSRGRERGREDNVVDTCWTPGGQVETGRMW